MTEQQESVLSLFNTKELFNMEIAQECAIQAGLGKWFNSYINKLTAFVIRELKQHDARYIDITHQCNSQRDYIELDKKKSIRFLANALVFWGCYIEVFPGRGEDAGDVFVSIIIRNSEDDFIEISFDWSCFSFVENLKNKNIVFDIYHH